MTEHVPNSVTILGTGANAADVALRSVLRFKDSTRSVLVLDYMGRGAMILGQENRMSLLRHRVNWYDLADRSKPIALFQLSRSGHFNGIMLGVLSAVRQVSRIPVPDATLRWATEAAYSLSGVGTVGLAALLRSFSSSEVRRWFVDVQNQPDDLLLLLKMLKWSLGFSSTYMISESVNRVHLETSLSGQSTTWIEMRSERFERYEHPLVAVLAEAAVQAAIRSVLTAAEAVASDGRRLTVVHLFPLPAIWAGMAAWIKETAHRVKHVGVHVLSPDRPPNPLTMSWALETSSLWIAGKPYQPLEASAHGNWLNEKEIDQINHLDRAGIWAKSNKTGKTIVARTRFADEYLGMVDKLRRESSRSRKIMPIRQTAAALASMADPDTVERDIYNRLCDPETLRFGWLRVAQNVRKGSRGIDNITASMFKENLESELANLAYELKSGQYRCRPLFRMSIPKHDGGRRNLGVACIRDRVVQTACLLLLEPIFEPVFSRYSFAFRPGRSAHQALALARSRIAAGRSWVVRADIKKCFDNIDHSVLLRLLSDRVGDQDLLNLIRHWLTVDVLDFNELLPIDMGIPQGESLSPLLSNIYLDPLDKHFERLRLDFIRYADDIVVLAKDQGEAEKALMVMQEFLMEPLRLELKPAKTHYVSIDEGFEFLGFRINGTGIEIKQERIDDVQEMLRLQIAVLGDPVSTLAQRADALLQINAVVRGWRNYFFLADEKRIDEQLRLLDGRMDEMASLHLPLSIRDDPAWICRERFSLARTIDDAGTEQEAAEREVKTGNGYPREQNSTRPQGWMIKGGSGNGEDERLRTPAIIVGDFSDEDGSTKGNEKDTLLEEGDRLYVLTHGSYLTVADDNLVIRKRKAEIHRRPLKEIGLLYLQGHGMNISVNLQLRLAELDIPAVFAPPVGEPMAVLNPIISTKSSLRGLQVLRRDDPDVVTTGLHMLASKMGNQAAVLRYFAKYRHRTSPDLGRQLTDAAEEIRGLADNVKNLDPGSASVRPMAMGFEGHAAAVYWGRLIKLIPTRFNFSGRVTRSATDVVNQCLNYTYGMLYGEVWRAIVKAGLDPYFGLIHGSKRDQGSLVFDLIEEFRAPFADRLMIGMLGRGFQPEIGDHGLLKTRTRKQLAAAFIRRWLVKMSWRSRRIDPAAILARQARDLARLFNREGLYHPFRMKW